MNVCSRVGPIPERFLGSTDFALVNEAAAIDKALEEGRDND
jgi:hypothetical protein